MHINILQPVVVLVLWTLVMLGWMMVVRGPAMRKIGVDITKVIGGRGQNLEGNVPERVQWPAHNYTHLMEQPTLFYAIAITIAVFGAGHGIAALVAWAYTLLRIAHSIVQATYNRVIVRFTLFALSSVALAGLAVHAAMLAF